MAVVAETLDLSRLPAPTLLKVEFERDLAERIERMKTLFDAAGIPYDVERLVTDPAGCLQEIDNYRETLSKQAVNNLYLQRLIAFSKGSDLDHIGATLHFLTRIDGEADDRYRYRLQLESENKAGGRLAGYIAEAMKVSLDVFAVGAWVDRSVLYEPVVRLAIQEATGNGAAASDLVGRVQQHIDRDDVRQATDVVVVQSVVVSSFAINVRIFHRSGPDPVMLRANATAALEKMVEERWRPGRDVPQVAVSSAAMVAGVERVEIVAPEGDLIVDKGGLATCVSISVTSEATGG